jgi:putative phosphoribosyl transferase
MPFMPTLGTSKAQRPAQRPGVHFESLALGPLQLPGDYECPEHAHGLVLFAHGSGSSRASPRTRFVADVLHGYRLATLRFDLLTPDEALDRRCVFDIPLLGERVVMALDAVLARHQSSSFAGAGLFGASTGAAAALLAAIDRPAMVTAVVSRGGRPDLVDEWLPRVRAPTLLIVGGHDHGVIELNESARDALVHCDRDVAIVPGATHLFGEKGALEQVARLATEWFVRHLTAVPARSERAG